MKLRMSVLKKLLPLFIVIIVVCICSVLASVKGKSPQQHEHIYSCVIAEASCTSNGARKYTCKDCGYSFNEEILPSGHTEVTVSKASTYTTHGYEDRVVCSACKAVFNKGKTVAKRKLGGCTLSGITATSIKSVRLTYTKVQNASGYIIYRMKYGDGKYIRIAKTSETTYTDTTAVCAYRYFYRVRAFVTEGKKEAIGETNNLLSIIPMPLYSQNDGFEESAVGATVWSGKTQRIYSTASLSKTKTSWIEGDSGKIIQVYGKALKISYRKDGKECSGYVNKNHVLINLPQVIPTVTYAIYNCYNSCYPVLINGTVKNIPEISGKNLYAGKRVKTTTLLRGTTDQWIVPCSYQTARRLAKAQRLALLDGYSIKVIDTYRPYSRSGETYNFVLNSEYAKYIEPNVNRFLAAEYSNHNKGIAVDCTLIDRETLKEVEMQTPYNLMSPKSYISNNNNNANRLQSYMVKSGFDPLEYEWYHFVDMNSSENSNFLNMNYPTRLY